MYSNEATFSVERVFFGRGYFSEFSNKKKWKITIFKPLVSRNNSTLTNKLNNKGNHDAL